MIVLSRSKNAAARRGARGAAVGAAGAVGAGTGEACQTAGVAPERAAGPGRVETGPWFRGGRGVRGPGTSRKVGTASARGDWRRPSGGSAPGGRAEPARTRSEPTTTVTARTSRGHDCLPGIRPTAAVRPAGAGRIGSLLRSYGAGGGRTPRKNTRAFPAHRYRRLPRHALLPARAGPAPPTHPRTIVPLDPDDSRGRRPFRPVLSTPGPDDPQPRDRSVRPPLEAAGSKPAPRDGSGGGSERWASGHW